jgi:hypothetical protein
MCSWISLRATDDKGKPRKDIPDLTFEVPPEFTPEYPTCTCWIALKDGDGKTLRHTFADTVLREMLEKVNWGNIIIEIR